ncbi:MAG: T9SS type A sorting domain-containing protein [Bacteroidia bacterium]
MKKIFTIIISVLVLSNFVIAQNFTIMPKSSKIQGASTKNTIEANVNFTNLSTDANDTIFNYEVIDVSMPTAWTLSNCDPFKCLEGSGVIGFKSNFIMKNTIGNNSGFFKIDFSPNGTPGNGFTKIVVKSAKSSYSDTIIVEAKVWGVSVKEVKQNKDFSFYPNPAKDELVVKYFSKESFQVEIYNILGSKVKSFNLNGGQANVNIEELSNGIYFMRFKDDEKVISKTFTKN